MSVVELLVFIFFCFICTHLVYLAGIVFYVRFKSDVFLLASSYISRRVFGFCPQVFFKVSEDNLVDVDDSLTPTESKSVQAFFSTSRVFDVMSFLGIV